MRFYKRYNRGTRCDSVAPRRKGIALIIMLVLITAIVVIGLGFIVRGDMELLCGQNMELKADMDYLAESGLEHAKGLILNPQDVLTDYWTGATGQQLVSGDDYYDVTISQLSSFNYRITSLAYREGSMPAQENLTAELRLNPCIVYRQSADKDIESSVVINGDAYFGDKVTNYGSINGDVYSAKAINNVPPGQIQGQSYSNVSQAPCNTPGISYSNFSSTYYIGANSYSVEQLAPGDYNSLTLLPNAGNPAGVYYCNGNLTIMGSATINGTLVVKDDFSIKDLGNVTIQSVKNFPALIVGKKLDMEKDNTMLTATGYTQVGDHIDMHDKSGCSITIYGALYILDDGIKNATGCSVLVDGMPHKACLAIWSSGENLTRWSPAAGAFYKSITRN